MAHDKRSAMQEIRQAELQRFSYKIRKKKRKQKGLARFKSIGSYQMTYLPKHPRADINGRIYTHRLVAEYHFRHLTYISPQHPLNDIIHHKDMNRSNNHPSNLAIMKNAEHRKLHNFMLHQNYL